MLCQSSLELSVRLWWQQHVNLGHLPWWQRDPGNTAATRQSSTGIGSSHQLTSALAASSLSAFSFSAFSFSRFSFSTCSLSAFSLAAASAAVCSAEVPASHQEDAVETTHWRAACELHACPAAGPLALLSAAVGTSTIYSLLAHIPENAPCVSHRSDEVPAVAANLLSPAQGPQAAGGGARITVRGT